MESNSEVDHLLRICDDLGLITSTWGRQWGEEGRGDRVLLYISEYIIQRDHGARNKNIRQYQEKSLRNRQELLTFCMNVSMCTKYLVLYYSAVEASIVSTFL